MGTSGPSLCLYTVELRLGDVSASLVRTLLLNSTPRATGARARDRTVLRLIARLKRFNRLMTPLRHLGNVLQLWHDADGNLRCERVQTRPHMPL